MRSLIVGMTAGIVAAMPFVVRAEQKTVPAGTTVTVAAADVAAWASADIDIGAGATLCFSEPTAATFTGAITGSGNFVAKAASESVVPQMLTLSGNASGFTGAFFFSNVFFTASNPQSVGSVAPITSYTAYTGDTGSKSLFLGPASGDAFVYQNNLDVYTPVKPGGCSALAVKSRAVLNGSVLHRKGLLLGPGKITGPITSSSTGLFVGDDLHIEGTVTFTASGAKLANYAQVIASWGYPDSGSLYLKGRTENLSKFNPIDCYWPVYLEGDNLFGENVELVGGEKSAVSGRKSFRLELNGHSQVFKRAGFSVGTEVPTELTNIGGIGNTGTPATVTFANQDSDEWFYGRLDGHLSVTVAGSKMLALVSPTNTLDGTVTHAGGGGYIRMGNEWPNIKNIVSRDGGRVFLGKSAKINPKVTIDIYGSSKINVANELVGELTVKVRRLRINGVDLPVGTYNKNSTAVSGHFETSGSGEIQVTGVPGSMLIVE